MEQSYRFTAKRLKKSKDLCSPFEWFIVRTKILGLVLQSTKKLYLKLIQNIILISLVVLNKKFKMNNHFSCHSECIMKKVSILIKLAFLLTSKTYILKLNQLNSIQLVLTVYLQYIFHPKYMSIYKNELNERCFFYWW